VTTQNIAPLVIDLSPSIWAVKPIDEQPELVLTDWAIFEVKMAHSSVRTRHFAGYNVRDREGRASSAMVTFDPKALTGITKSGRVYHLSGRPGLSGDGLYVWGRWLRINKSTDVVDITNSVLP
jgi:hypothetical protein